VLRILGLGICAFVFALPAFAGESISKKEFEEIQATQKRVVDLRMPGSKPEQVKAFALEAIRKADGIVKRILAYDDDQVSFANTALALDTALLHAEKAMARLGLVVGLESGTPQGEEAREQTLKLEKWSNELYLNRKLYDRISSLYPMKLDQEHKRLLDVLLASFVVHSKKIKETLDSFEMSGLYDGVAKHTDEFEANLYKNAKRSFTKAQLKGASDDWLARLPFDGKHYEVDGSQWWQFDHIRRFCEVEATRKATWEATETGADPANLQLIDVIAGARTRIAKRLGYASWAAHNTDFLSANPSTLGKEFLKIKNETESGFKAEKKRMREFLGREPKMWDIEFVAEKERQAIGIKEAEIRNYFALEDVAEGLFRYAEEFFGIEIREVENTGLWEELRLFSVFDSASGKFMGVFGLDPHPREGKDPGFMMTSFGGSKLHKDGTFERPFGIVHANFAPARNGQPSLLTFEEVWTLFHEVGHALHDVLNEQTYYSLSGDSANLDLVEFPSTFMELLAWEPEIIQRIGRHWKTREPISSDLAQKISQLRTVFYNHRLRQRMTYSVLDLRLHSSRPRSAEVTEQEVFEEFFYPLPAEASVVGSFGYFSGYDATFWTYLWNEALASQRVRRLKASPGGLFDVEEGLDFRNKFFKVAGRYASNQLIKNTLGEDFSFCSALLANGPAQASKTSKRSRGSGK